MGHDFDCQQSHHDYHYGSHVVEFLDDDYKKEESSEFIYENENGNESSSSQKYDGNFQRKWCNNNDEDALQRVFYNIHDHFVTYSQFVIYCCCYFF